MSINIMVIDDDLDDVELFKEAVGDIDSSLKCFSALSGMEAISLLETGEVKPDIIVVDLNMPMLSGKDFIRMVREKRAFDTVQLFLYSTCDLTKNIIDLESIGADGFFRKPTRFSDLLTKISDLIQRYATSQRNPNSEKLHQA